MTIIKRINIILDFFYLFKNIKIYYSQIKDIFRIASDLCIKTAKWKNIVHFVSNFFILINQGIDQRLNNNA